MLIPFAAVALRVLWLAIEYPYLRRFRVAPTQDWDRNSARAWDIANLIEPVGLLLGLLGVGRIQTASQFIAPLGLTLLLVGIVIRGTAIWTLGTYFTGTVLIKNNHELIRTGLYKYLRHPSYAGALLAHLGLGLAFLSWFSLLLSSVPFFIAAFYRIHVEEIALEEKFKCEYLNYAKATKRLIPGLY
jgi:protein-S-isoprenylcysteine O-methyltransferase Ste14